MSDTAIQTRPETITRDNILDYLQSFGLIGQLSPQEAQQFVEVSTAFQLNPFKREIYCIPYGQGDKRKLSIITGYETYLKRADRIGKLKGWKAWTEGTFTVETKKVTLEGRNGPYTKEKRLPVGDLIAKIEIHRDGWDKPFEHEVYLEEYAQDNEMWANKPRTMLKKVCIAQAFRMCFPDEMGGMPYTSDELPPEKTQTELARAEDQETVIMNGGAAPEAVAEKVGATTGNMEPPELSQIKDLVKELGIEGEQKKRLWAFFHGDYPAILARLLWMKDHKGDPDGCDSVQPANPAPEPEPATRADKNAGELLDIF